MIKKILTLLLIINLNGCGYSPMFKYNNDLNFKITKISFEFKELFNTNECIKTYSNQAGGNLSDFKDNKILFTTGAFKTFEDLSGQKENIVAALNEFLSKKIEGNDGLGFKPIISAGFQSGIWPRIVVRPCTPIIGSSRDFTNS